MFNKLDLALIGAKNRLDSYLKELVEKEDGSIMVEIIILIVVIIAVAAIFKDRLGEAVGAIFDKVTTTINDGV